MRVLRTSGAEFEAEVGFSALHQLGSGKIFVGGDPFKGGLRVMRL
jgi:hypothetical protein